MKTKNLLLPLMVGAIALSQLLFISCSSTDKVVSSNYIQKRKYMKGYYVDMNLKKDKMTTQESVGSSQLAVGNEEREEFSMQPNENVVSAENNTSSGQEKMNGDVKPIRVIPRNAIQKAVYIYKEGIDIETTREKKISTNTNNNKRETKKINKFFGSEEINGIALASFICGIGALVLLLIGGVGSVGVAVAFGLISLVASILAIVFGFSAIGQIKRGESSHEGGSQQGKGLAIAGIVLGFLEIFLWIIVTVAVLSVL